MTALVLILFVLLIVIIVVVIRYERKVLRRSWRNVLTAFSENKIQVTSAIPEKKIYHVNISGNANGVNVKVHSEYTGTGKNKYIITKIELSGYGYTLPDFTLYRETALSKIGEVLGTHDIKTGNEEFDKIFRLKSNQDEHVKKFFNDSLCNLFLNYKASFGDSLSCTGNRVITVVTGAAGNKNAFRYFQTMLPLSIEFFRTKGKVQGHSPRVV